MKYGSVQREGDVNADGIGIGGGIGPGPDGYAGHVTFYVEVPDVEAALVKAESLGGSRMFGPDVVTEGVEIGQFSDPRATWSVSSSPRRRPRSLADGRRDGAAPGPPS